MVNLIFPSDALSLRFSGCGAAVGCSRVCWNVTKSSASCSKHERKISKLINGGDTDPNLTHWVLGDLPTAAAHESGQGAPQSLWTRLGLDKDMQARATRTFSGWLANAKIGPGQGAVAKWTHKHAGHQSGNLIGVVHPTTLLLVSRPHLPRHSAHEHSTFALAENRSLLRQLRAVRQDQNGAGVHRTCRSSSTGSGTMRTEWRARSPNRGDAELPRCGAPQSARAPVERGHIQAYTFRQGDFHNSQFDRRLESRICIVG